MDISSEKIQSAKQAGYSDSEIADFLSQQGLGDKIGQAKQAGYSDEEIINHLSEKTPVTEKPPEGIHPEETKNYIEKVGDFLKGLPQGLGNKAVGLTQSVTDAVAPDSKFSKNLASEVTKLKQRQSQLPSYEKGGITGGQILSDIALSPTKGLGVGTGAAIGGAISGLTTPMEKSGAEERLKQVGKDTLESAATGKILQGIGKEIGSAGQGVKNTLAGIYARTPEELQNVVQGIKKKSSDLYQSMRNAGVVLSPDKATEITGDLRKTMEEQGKLNSRLHGDTMSVIDDFEKASKEGLGLHELDQYRQNLGDVVKKNTDIAGHMNGDAYLANKLINKIDNNVDKLDFNSIANKNPELQKQVETAKNSLENARKTWSQARKIEKVSSLLEKGDGDANRIKSIFQNFVINKKNLIGFSPEEKQALKNVAKNSTGEFGLKMLGKFGLDVGGSMTKGNAALPIFGAVEGEHLLGPAGIPIALGIGTGARQLQKYLARGKGEKALQLLEKGYTNPKEVLAKSQRDQAIKDLLNKFSKNAGIGATTLINQ